MLMTQPAIIQSWQLSCVLYKWSFLVFRFSICAFDLAMNLSDVFFVMIFCAIMSDRTSTTELILHSIVIDRSTSPGYAKRHKSKGPLL